MPIIFARVKSDRNLHAKEVHNSLSRWISLDRRCFACQMRLGHTVNNYTANVGRHLSFIAEKRQGGHSLSSSLTYRFTDALNDVPWYLNQYQADLSGW